MASKVNKRKDDSNDFPKELNRRKDAKSNLPVFPRNSMSPAERESCFCELIVTGIQRVLDRQGSPGDV